MTNTKPVVHYSEMIVPPVVGGRAMVVTVNHHDATIRNGEPVRTSTVVAVGDNGSFETRNTMYERQASE